MRLVFGVLFSLFFFGSVFAFYEPTPEDLKFVAQVKEVVDQDVATDPQASVALLEWYYAFDDTLEHHQLGTRKRFIVDSLMSLLRKEIDQQKKSARDALSASLFLDTYWPFVLTKEEVMPDGCFSSYQLVDDWSWALDVPTALVIATWKMEATCKMYLPANGDGPFQIVKNDYGTGDISQSGFIAALRDFVSFSEAKWDRYNYLNEDDGFVVQFSYSGYTFNDLVRHGSLYNGLSGYTMYGDALPLNADYVFGQFGEAYSGANKDGLLVNFLKVLQWEQVYLSQ